MQSNRKKIVLKLLSALLIVALSALIVSQLILAPSGSERYFSGDAERYYLDLIDAGFPKDYALDLTELHLLHPNWSFTPLLITEQEPSYTWDYVIDRETSDGELNVIYSSVDYIAYHHPFNKETYDSGNYYQASTKTVEYFMDPRNFLNEADIFQFYSLTGNESVSLSQVEAVLSGTFMEDKALMNGMTYAEYFLHLGEELDVNPIFLAAKIRQEQGTQGTSPLISGKCGTKLRDFYVNQTEKTDSGSAVLPPKYPFADFTAQDLLALDGLYNYFNVGATGKGVFAIYHNAMKRALTGTSAMAETWGDGGAWNTDWKALYGGTYFLKANYIDRYQSTVYLQKFDVDSRSGSDFSHQYMTAVYGAMSEARSLHRSFAALDLLDAPATFLIPVYADMPTDPCADPANGSCTLTCQATERYDFQCELTAPQRLSNRNKAIYLDCEVYPNDALSLAGVVTHEYCVEGLEYAWNGGEWQSASDGKNLDLSIPVNEDENTSHILVIRGKTSSKAPASSSQTVYTYFVYAVVYVKVLPLPRVTLTFETKDTQTELILVLGESTELPSCDEPDFVGWYTSDGELFPAGAALTPQTDLHLSPVLLDFDVWEGAALSTDSYAPHLRFSALLKKSVYTQLTSSPFLTFKAKISSENEILEISELPSKTLTQPSGQEWIRLDAVTNGLSVKDFSKPYEAEFYAVIHYTDGTEQTVVADAPAFTRTAKQIAEAALADTSAEYSAEARELLTFVATYTQT